MMKEELKQHTEPTDFEQEEAVVRDYLVRHTVAAPDIEAELRRFKAAAGKEKRVRFVPRRLLWAFGMAAAFLAAVWLVTWPFDAGKDSCPPLADGERLAYVVSDSVPASIMLGDEPVSAKGRPRRVAVRAQALSKGEMSSLATPYGTTAELTLADGTTVTLAAGSRLCFPTEFSGPERRVELRGEAYFKVAHDAAHPFIVEARGLTTRVLGTEFNVRAWGNAAPSVTLVEGSVTAGLVGSNPRLRPVTLSPGEEAEAQGGELVVAKADVASRTAWVRGEFYFDNVAVSNIATEIGRWYGLNVVLSKGRAADTRIFLSASRLDAVDDIVELLNSYDHVHARLEGRTLYIEP